MVAEGMLAHTACLRKYIFSNLNLQSYFQGFCEKVEGVTKGELEFDSPFRELGYHGVPFRETVLLLPTSACLIR